MVVEAEVAEMTRRVSLRDELRGALRGDKGQALPIVVFFLLILLGIASLVIDGGMAYAQRRYMQNAADAASLAGVTLMTQGVTNDAQINSRAVQYGQANRAMTVTVEYVDTAGNVLAQAGQGTYPSGANGIKVTARTVYRPGLAAVLGLGAFNIAADATVNIRLGAGNALILALSSSACPGMTAGGSGAVTAIDGNIQVNSNCNEALNHTGGGMLKAVNAAINVTGLYRQGGSGIATPPPNEHMPVVPDPYASLNPPNKSLLSVRGAGTAAKPKTLLINTGASTTLDPGVYYGGIKFTGGGHLTLRPGIYYIAGGELTLVGSGNVAADGVMFYLTNDPDKPTVDGRYAAFNFAGTAGSRLRPASSGAYKGILVFQDRANTMAANVTGGGNNVSGALYFKNADLKIGGSATWSGAVQLIANTIETKGSQDMTFIYDLNLLPGTPMPKITK